MGKEIKGKELKTCPDCGTEPGQIHSLTCDVEVCSECGEQRLGCGCDNHDRAFARWTGLWPGRAEANALGVDLNDFAVKYRKFFNVKPEIDIPLGHGAAGPHEDPMECPTWYDYCHCTVENLTYNIEERSKMHDKMGRIAGMCVNPDAAKACKSILKELGNGNKEKEDEAQGEEDQGGQGEG